MLVLSRKSGECVRIGSSIEVKVLEVSGGRVKLGFSAPADVAIQRNEICGICSSPFAGLRQIAPVDALCSV